MEGDPTHLLPSSTWLFVVIVDLVSGLLIIVGLPYPPYLIPIASWFNSSFSCYNLFDSTPPPHLFPLWGRPPCHSPFEPHLPRVA